MSQEKTKKSIKSILNILWAIIFVVLAVGSITINNSPKLQLCLSDQVELQDYYMNFLWPALYKNINLLYAIIVVVCGLVYYNAATDISVGLSDRSAIHIKNISIAITAIAGGIYVAVGIFYFKRPSAVTVVIGLMIVLAVVSLVANMIECKGLDKEETITEVIKPVMKRLVVILVAIFVCSIWLLKPLPEMKKETDKYYYKIYNQLVRISFGHKEDVETNRALVKYEFVRRYSDSGREYDLEQLKVEYSNYLSGEGSWSNLWYFCHDSMDIELKSQQIEDSNQIGRYDDIYPYSEAPDYGYGGDNLLSEYYNIEDRDFEKQLTAVKDKVGDLEFFCTCVEKELNSRGLTLSQEGDSTMRYGKEALKYRTATKEEVLAACDSFEANVE